MVTVNWTYQSITDIENIADFISKDSDKYANIQVQRFFEIEKVISSNPEAGRIVPEINNKVIREIIQGNYRIIYRVVNKKLIDILTVHHSKRLLYNNPVLKNEG